MRERCRRLVGRVTSDRMDKTVVVRVERSKRHPQYSKVVRMAKKYKAHDEHNTCHVGDLVRIVESRPLSRHKRWVVERVLERCPELVEGRAEMPPEREEALGHQRSGGNDPAAEPAARC